MKCVFCDGQTKIVDTRKNKDGRRYRRRKCTSCDKRFTTYEVNQVQMLNLLDKFLPVRLVDQVSHVLARGYPEREKDNKYS